MAVKTKIIDANGYSSTARFAALLGKNGSSIATVANPVPVDAIVTVDTMNLTAELSEATGHDYHITTTNVGNGVLTISFDAVVGLTLADIVKVENKTQGWVYVTKGATVTNTTILLVAANQTTGYPVPGAADKFEIVYRGASRFTNKTQMSQITDGTTEVDVIATINSLKTDTSSIAGTATVVNGGNRSAGVQTVTLADDDPVVVDLAAIEILNTTIAGDTTSIDGKTPTLGTAIMTGAVPITIATDDTLTAAANALLTTIDVDTGVIAGDTTSLDTKTPALGTAAMVASSPVTIASDDTLTAAANALLTTIDADTSNIQTAVAIPTTLTGGELIVTTSGTALALGASLATKSIYIRAKSTNGGNVYVGDSAVDATTSQQIILAANDSVTIPISNRATVYVDAAVNGEGVDYLASS